MTMTSMKLMDTRTFYLMIDCVMFIQTTITLINKFLCRVIGLWALVKANKNSKLKLSFKLN